MRQIRVVGAVAVTAFSALWAPTSPRSRLKFARPRAFRARTLIASLSCPRFSTPDSATARSPLNIQQSPKGAFMLDVEDRSTLRTLQDAIHGRLDRTLHTFPQDLQTEGCERGAARIQGRKFRTRNSNSGIALCATAIPDAFTRSASSLPGAATASRSSANSNSWGAPLRRQLMNASAHAPTMRGRTRNRMKTESLE
jgi:hypothetical protein